MVIAIVIVVVLVLAALVAGAYLQQNRRRAALQERFGPEYDRAVEGASTRREAEQHLSGVAQRRDELTVRDLDESERSRFSAEWDVVQARFVDEPAAAVDSAETLISTVMRERGYPVEDFDEQADLVAADHPEVVQHYREAHAAHERHRSAGGLDTEDLRQSFMHYRALFAVLVQNDELVPDSAVDRHEPVSDQIDDEPVSAPAAASASDPVAPPAGPASTDPVVAPEADVERTSPQSSYPQETR